MERWTIQRLNELDDKKFAICILQERLNRLSNPYSPLATKLAQTIRHLADRDGTEKKVYCERYCIHQNSGICWNDAIAVSDEGFCCDYAEKEDE